MAQDKSENISNHKKNFKENIKVSTALGDKFKFTNEKGGIVDDLIVYRLKETEYLLVVNASNIDKDWNWVEKHNSNFGALLENKSEETALLAIQGPKQGDCLVNIESLEIKVDPLGRSFSDFKSVITNQTTSTKIDISQEVPVKQGEEIRIELSLGSEISAEGISKGLIIVKTITPDSSQSLDLVADLEFASKLTPPPTWLPILLAIIGPLVEMVHLVMQHH